MPNVDLTHLRVLTHSAIRLESADGETVVYADPFDLVKESHDATLVLITHPHYDHLSPADYARVANGSTEVVAPASIANEVATLDAAETHLMRAGETLDVHGVRIEAIAAYNTDPSRFEKHPQENGWLGYVVTLDGVRYLIAGDTDEQPDNRSVTCDVALVPIGGTFTMDPVQAAALINRIQPRVAVPTHYGNIVGAPEDAKAFAAAVDPGIAVEVKLER